MNLGIAKQRLASTPNIKATLTEQQQQRTQLKTKHTGRAIQKEAARMAEWISVRERLPNNFSQVIGYMAWGGMSVVQYESERFFSQGAFAPLPKEAVTYWMPLPEPPEEGGGEE